ncbi:MAG: DUF2652 domain-containing protein [Candidatus Promineifilaceae bacterium]
MVETYEGYFLIADITGYTQYLSESELEHAQETLTALLELLVDNTRPPLVISRLAGDAVISYGLLENFYHGQSFIEKIEDSYVDFRKTLERLVLNNTCRCNACANISNLDLKFFVHYGTFGIQRISDHDELVGSDVILLHRLLKNSVTERTGFRGYTLYSHAAIIKLGIEEMVENMIPLVESYEHLGEVEIWVQDMHAVWSSRRESAATEFSAEGAVMRSEVDIDVPNEIVWDYLIQPEFRNLLVGADRMEITDRTQGRISEGSVYQCYHGDKVIPQTILEWEPFSKMILKELFPFYPDVSFLTEYRLGTANGKTRLYRTVGKPTGPFIGRVLLSLMTPMFKRYTSQANENFSRAVENDYLNRGKSEMGGAEITSKQIRLAAAAGLRD